LLRPVPMVATSYPDLQQNPNYSAIINARHAARLHGYLDDAAAHGAHIVPLVPLCRGKSQSERTAATGPNVDSANRPTAMKVMQEEIFGPLLPILTYQRIFRKRSTTSMPTTGRWRSTSFDRDKTRINQVLDQTIAGGVTVNDTILHIAQDDLPFGGVGPSGMGQYHGYEGFLNLFQAEAGLLPVAPQRHRAVQSALRQAVRAAAQAAVAMTTRREFLKTGLAGGLLLNIAACARPGENDGRSRAH
jgi:coniferyl-aldehyde dehydrogenase